MPFQRLALLALCVLPVLGIAAPGRPATVASFIHSCDASNPDPRVRTRYTAPGRPTPRRADALVAVYEAGKSPARKFVAIGEVDVLASGSRTAPSELTEWAQKGARRLGGDALVDVRWDDAASVKPPAGPVGLLYLTATVVRWE